MREKKVPQVSHIANGEGTIEAGQTRLLNGANGFAAHGAAGEDGEDPAAADPIAQLEMESKSAKAEHTDANGDDGDTDVEMGVNEA